MIAALLGLLGLWVLLGAVWFAVYPLLERGRPLASAAALELQDLETEKARLLGEIHELQLDYATGKLSDEDFAALERRLKARAVEVMREIDAGEAALRER